MMTPPVMNIYLPWKQEDKYVRLLNNFDPSFARPVRPAPAEQADSAAQAAPEEGQDEFR